MKTEQIFLMIAVYIVGFILTLLFYKIFGKKIGFDYSGPQRFKRKSFFFDNDYDDWDSNATAYTSFSLVWVITVPILLIMGSWALLITLTRKIIKD